jgi:DNA-binding transcriptional LysR family regulator
VGITVGILSVTADIAAGITPLAGRTRTAGRTPTAGCGRVAVTGGMRKKRLATWLTAPRRSSTKNTAKVVRELIPITQLTLVARQRPRRWELQRGRTHVAIEVAGPLHSNNAFVLLTACRNGAGIGLLPASVSTAGVRSGELRRVLPGWTSLEQGIYAVYPSARFIPAKVRAFVEFVAARLRGSGEN